MRGVFYFSGCHGSGKSTLIRRLQENTPDTYLLSEKLPVTKLDDNLERTRLRLARHYLHFFANLRLSEENPDKIVLGDRCFVDSLAYVGAFYDLGWITRKEYEEHNLIGELMFNGRFDGDNLIILNPTVDELLINLRKRWNIGKKKWKEDNIDYLRAVRNSYDKLTRNYPGALVLNTMDLDERTRLASGFIDERTKGFKHDYKVAFG